MRLLNDHPAYSKKKVNRKLIDALNNLQPKQHLEVHNEDIFATTPFPACLRSMISGLKRRTMKGTTVTVTWIKEDNLCIVTRLK